MVFLVLTVVWGFLGWSGRVLLIEARGAVCGFGGFSVLGIEVLWAGSVGFWVVFWVCGLVLVGFLVWVVSLLVAVA